MELLLNDLSALLGPVAVPPFSLFILLLLGLFWYRRFIGKFFAWVSFAALVALSLPITSQWLAKPLEVYPPVSTEQLGEHQIQAILVLTGGVNQYDQNKISTSTMQRLLHAASLHRSTGIPLVISGGAPRSIEAEAVLAEKWLRQHLDIDVNFLESNSNNTWENAKNSAQLLKDNGLEKVALVTHALHMPRAMLAAQQQGINAIPVPLAFIYQPDKAFILRDWLPDADAMQQNAALVHEHIGMFWYRLLHVQ
jgi:uncharacterized SAM-binding protein YcdF (DUF218 family)